ncbi:MAG: bifunctional glycosyltransferase/class I SAM-dependent methyltransferase [Actinomycetota bacterium]|nr:bifunctional glycosyltransferase/class I SAM-dependent methyltransferase [Actinomycetota bacterium]
MPKVVITMPAFRAGLTLAKTVADIPEGVADELILVDDASPDNTVELARSLGIKVFVHPQNRGYGGNQKTCYTQALAEDADVIVMLHPDYQYEPKAVPLLIAPILAGDADMTFGSRFAGLGDPRGGGMPMYRFVGNRLTTILQNWMLGSRFTEMHSGMRAYTRDCLLTLPFLAYEDDFSFDEQCMVDAVTSGLRVVEVPIPTRYTKESSSISIVRSLQYVTRGVTYCARQVAKRGRRGRNNPVAWKLPRPASALGVGASSERACPLCGGHEHSLVERGAGAAVRSVLQCVKCGLLSVDNPSKQPGEQDWTNPVLASFETAQREFYEQVVRYLDSYVVDGKKLVQLGSGPGIFLDVARRRGWGVSGIDESVAAAAIARERFEVEVSDAVDAVPAGVDAFVLLDQIATSPDPVEVLMKIKGLLARHGLIVLSTPLPAEGYRRGEPMPAWITTQHFAFTQETMHALLNRTGYRMVGWEVLTPSRLFDGSVAARGLAIARPSSGT